jgi:hypothetical protein
MGLSMILLIHFLATTGKQAHLTETMKFLNKVETLGTKGKNK